MDYANFAYSLVVTAPSPATSGTSLVVSAGDGAKFPTPPFYATIWPVGTMPSTTNAEIVLVTNIVTDTFTITRQQEGTAARTIIVGDRIANTITANTIKNLVATSVDAVTVKADHVTEHTTSHHIVMDKPVVLPAGTAVAGTAPITFVPGTVLTTPEVGTLECSTSGLFHTTLGDRRSLTQSSQPIVSSTTVANSANETTIYTTNLAANELIVGETVTTEAYGVVSAVAESDLITFKIKVGGVVISTVTSSIGKIITDTPWRIKSTFTVRSVGNPGTVQAFCAFEIDNENRSVANIGTTAVDTTAISNITITVQWNAAKTGNSITISQGYSMVMW